MVDEDRDGAQGPTSIGSTRACQCSLSFDCKYL